MNRETKLALLLGFCAIVVVGVLVGEHFSKGRNDRPATTELGVSNAPAPTAPANPAFAADPYNTNTGTPAMLPPGAGNPVPVQPVNLTMDPAAAAANGGMQPAAGNTGGGVRDTFLPAGGGNNTGMPVYGSRAGNDDYIPMTEPVTNTSLPVSSGTVKLYPVKRGETLPIIAEKFYGNKSFSTQLSDYNKKRLSANGTVREGVTLHIPPKDVLLGKATMGDGFASVTNARPEPAVTKPVATASKPKTETKPVAAKPANKPGTYVIKKGDTLGHIAAATLGSSKRWEAILDANPNLDEDNLLVGTTIKIPAK